jgi:branched-chain amino acid transport system permease protein
LRRALGIVIAVAVFGLLALVPKISLDTHGVFSSELNSPGTLQLLGLMLVFGGVALTYDLLFGFTGLLSFGHALYFAVGVYLTAIGTTKWDWSLPKTLACSEPSASGFQGSRSRW